MGYSIQQNQTAVPLLFRLYESGSNAPATGKSPTVTLSKNGGSFAAPVGAVTEIGNGVYQVAANATDAGVLGPLVLHASADDCDDATEEFLVVAYDPFAASNLGLTNLNAAIDTRATTQNVTDAQGAVIQAIGEIDVDTSAIADAVVDGVEREGGMLAQVADNSGTGAYTVTVTVTDGTNALQNATVRLSEGGNSYTTKTNASGVATFALDAATYAMAVTKAGYSFTPTTVVADAEHTEFAAAMTQMVIPSSPTPGMVYVLCNAGDFTEAVPGVLFEMELVQPAPVVMGNEMQVDRKQKGVTGEDGTVLLTVWPSSALTAAGYNGRYLVRVRGATVATVIVPDGGGSLGDLVRAGT